MEPSAFQSSTTDGMPPAPAPSEKRPAKERSDAGAAHLARVRENQRRSRARRKEYLAELEEKFRRCEQSGAEASAEMQQAARRVLDENVRLKALLHSKGVSEDELNALAEPLPPFSPGPSASDGLEVMLSGRRRCGAGSDWSGASNSPTSPAQHPFAAGAGAPPMGATAAGGETRNYSPSLQSGALIDFMPFPDSDPRHGSVSSTRSTPALSSHVRSAYAAPGSGAGAGHAYHNYAPPGTLHQQASQQQPPFSVLPSAAHHAPPAGGFSSEWEFAFGTDPNTDPASSATFRGPQPPMAWDAGKADAGDLHRSEAQQQFMHSVGRDSGHNMGLGGYQWKQEEGRYPPELDWIHTEAKSSTWPRNGSA